MNEEWTQEKVQQFNEMEPSEYMNVVALAGGEIRQPEPEGLTAVRIIAHQNERINTLVDFIARLGQQLQDELDEAGARGESRPDLQVLLDEHEQLLEAV